MLRRIDPVPPVIAVDPGFGVAKSSGTGICAVIGTEVIESVGLRLHRDDDLVSYTKRVSSHIQRIRDEHPEHQWTIAVEAMISQSSTPHHRRTRKNPAGTLMAGQLAGAIWGRFAGVLVSPGGNGQHHLGCTEHARCIEFRKTHSKDYGLLELHYPDCLIGTRPKGWYGDGGERSHERSAFDVCFKAWSSMPRKPIR